MTRYRSSPNELPQYPEYLVPVMVYYGGTEATEDLGGRPYACPFHGDTTPSGTINTAAGWFHCMAFADCPQGNAVQIVMRKEDLSYREAVERAESIARKYGKEVSSTPASRRSGGSRGKRSGGARLRRSWK